MIQNRKQQVLYYLINFNHFNLADVINDSMFYKFQSRLGEIEEEIGRLIATRERVKFTNKFGRKDSYVVYNAIDKEECKELLIKYSK